MGKLLFQEYFSNARDVIRHTAMRILVLGKRFQVFSFKAKTSWEKIDGIKDQWTAVETRSSSV